ATGRPVDPRHLEGQALKLRDLLVEDPVDAPWQTVEVAGLAADSRKVGRGFLFFAVPGVKADGAAFARAAIAAGAIAVAAEQPVADLPAGVIFIPVKNARRALALAAAAFYPRQP